MSGDASNGKAITACNNEDASSKKIAMACNGEEEEESSNDINDRRLRHIIGRQARQMT